MTALPLLFALAACLPGPRPRDVPEFVEQGPAEITELTMECDLELEQWTLEVETLFWSGGGRLYLTTDGVYVEQHVVSSRRAAADGSTDELQLELAIVADWRDASPDRSTAMLCSDNPNGLFVLYDIDAETELECRFWGPDGGVWEAVEELPSCAEQGG